MKTIKNTNKNRLITAVKAAKEKRLDFEKVVALGFDGGHASRILRIAKGPDSVYSEYQAGNLSFGAAIDAARQAPMTPQEREAVAIKRIRLSMTKAVKMATHINLSEPITVRVGGAQMVLSVK